MRNLNLSEVYFYHVTKQTVESALPLLLTKAVEAGWSMFIRGKEDINLKSFDDAIWSAQPDSFLPHAVLGSQNDDKCSILLGTEDHDSSRLDFLVSVNGASISAVEVAEYKRCALLFDAKDVEEMTSAREQWVEFTNAGIPAKYWSQETGVWSLKKEN